MKPLFFHRDISIAGLKGEAVTCDLFLPPGGWGLRPALVFVHGGGFVGGDKDQFLGAASWLAMAGGAVCMTVQYRLPPAGCYPAPVIDCLSVFQWIFERKEELEINPELIFAVGGSPGANIAAIALMAEDTLLNWYGLDGARLFRPGNAVFLNGIFDLNDFYFRNPGEQKNVCAYLNRTSYEEELWSQSSPINHGRPRLHVLFLHGSQDAVVPWERCREMKSRLEALGGAGIIKIFPGKSHGWFNRPEHSYDVFMEILKFINNRRKEVEEHGA